MARVRDPPVASKPLRQTRNTARTDVAEPAPAPELVVTKKGTSKATSYTKLSSKPASTERELAYPIAIPGVKANTLKRTHDDNDDESRLTAVSKKPRNAPGAVKAANAVQTPAVPTHRSVRPQVKMSEAGKKRKRRTKAEIEADKAKAEEEKKKREELIAETHRVMEQINVDEDINRAVATTQAIRTFAELDTDSESGEEFVGIDEISSDENDEDEDTDTNEAVEVKKTQVSQLCLLSCYIALTRLR
jgi:hypothetical protein